MQRVSSSNNIPKVARHARGQEMMFALEVVEFAGGVLSLGMLFSISIAPYLRREYRGNR